MSELERKWWFVSIARALAGLATTGLLHAAGIQPLQYTAAQWIVWFLCSVSLQRCFSFLGWMTVLIVSPKTIIMERT